MHNPFSLEELDEAPIVQEMQPELVESDNTHTYLRTAQARTSQGHPVRIARRKRIISTTRFEPEYNVKHASKTKHYGIEIHDLLSSAAELLPSNADRLMADTTPAQQQTGMWVDKYRPRKFTELLGDERTNRDVMRWIKRWDYCVFGTSSRKSKKANEALADDVQSDPHDRPERKILMLAGPPGFGKTTLAHIAAKQAGYEVIEVNASDDRTGAVVQNKIGDALESQAVFSPRPSLVIIDEVDGVSGAGGEAGFIRSLLKFLVDDEKTTAQRNQNKAGVSTVKKKTKKKGTKALLRPIICICNDQYVAALRPLRQYCQIINFRPLSIPTVVSRLRNICHTEGLQADVRALNALCEVADSDIRSCVNSLQYVRMNSKTFNLDSVASTLAKRDVSRSSHSVVEAVFKLLDAKKERKKGLINPVKQDTIARLADLAMTNNEYGKILNGCFAHYPSAPYHDNLLSKPTAASDWLYFYDRCERGVYDNQRGELMAYMPYPIAAFHLLFATHESASNLERSKADYEQREKLRINSEIMSSWLTLVKPSVRQLFNPHAFATELVSYAIRIIGTNLNPANAHLIKTSERLALARVVDGMLGLGLDYTQYRVDGGSYIFRLEPPVLQLLDYDGIITLKGESLLPARYAARQIISAELASEKIRRSQESQLPIEPVAPKAQEVKKRKRDLEDIPLDAPAVKRDFFGRAIVQQADVTLRAVMTVTSKPKAKVFIKFSDGFSDAVRNNITISQLLGLDDK